MSEAPQISDDDPVRLSDAVTMFFPAGGVTLSTLRTEARKGRLVIERIGGKDFVTRRAIQDMRKRCRAPESHPASSSEPREESGSGSSETGSGMSAQDALRIRLQTPASRFANTSRTKQRSEAARLLWTAYRSPHHKHLVRFILIGLYTGTRHRAILGLQWMSNTVGGWVDVEKGVLYRRSLDSRETNKRRPPTRIPPRLLAHLRRWREADNGIGTIVTYEGNPVRRIEKAFRGVRSISGLDSTVTPHVLRHTRATWLMQKGIDLWDAAGSLGMTIETLQNVYGHHHPDFQRKSAEAY